MASYLSYTWACVDIASGGACADSLSFRNLMSASTAELLVTSGTLPAGQYRFSVTALKGPGFRSSSTVVTITVVNTPIIDVAVQRQLPTGVCSTHDKLVLRRVVNTTGEDLATCRWSVDNNVDLADPAVASTAVDAEVMVVMPGNLRGALTYTFSLNCSTPAGRHGQAHFKVAINAPPTSGILLVNGVPSAPSVTVPETVEVSAINWVDELTHRPLSYEFRYSDPANPGTEHVLASSSSNTVTVVLPNGTPDLADPARHFVIDIIVYVADRYGAQARASSRLVVFPMDFASAGDALDQAGTLMNTSLTTAEKTGDVRKLLQYCVVFSDMVQKASTLRRRQLQTAAEAEALVTAAVERVRDAAAGPMAAGTLDAVLIRQFMATAESVTRNTVSLETVSQSTVLTLFQALLQTSLSNGDVVTVANMEVVATAMQNVMAAGRLYESTTSDSTAASLALTAADLASLIGRALLTGGECGEMALQTDVAAFSVSAARYCRADLAVELRATHRPVAMVSTASPVVPSGVVAVDTSLSLMNDDVYRFTARTAQNLSSPVLSLRTYRADDGVELALTGSGAMVVVPRGAWAVNSLDTTTLCGHFDRATYEWVYCTVVAASSTSATCECPSARAVATIQNASQCIQHTDCFHCLSDTACGWCPSSGRCFEGNSAAAFYPGTCGADWSYDSCPCESFQNCGDCMDTEDPFSGKPKRSCGYCPATETCMSRASTVCPAWNINFVVGTESSCPLQCDSAWGTANGYDIPGCTNGECQQYISCACRPGFWSPDCSRTCPGGSANPCSRNGECHDGNLGTGKCFCNLGYGGTDCQDCDEAHHGADCTAECDGLVDGIPCHGNGLCSSGEEGDGHCSCFRGFFGDECEQSCPGGRVQIGVQALAGVCSGHGSCEDERFGSGLCTCHAGYFAADCGGQCPAAADGAGGSAVCGGPAHGSCSDGATGSGVCTCQPTFFGRSCAHRCPGSTNATFTCTGNGVCSDGATGSGRCACLDGHRGTDCSLPPLRVRLTLTFDISWREWQLYNLSATGLDPRSGQPRGVPAKIAMVLGIQPQAVLSIGAQPAADTDRLGSGGGGRRRLGSTGAETVAFFELLSIGLEFYFASSALDRLAAFSPAQLTSALQVPVLSWAGDTFTGTDWPCDPNPDTGLICGGWEKGTCDNVTGTCQCEEKWAGVDCAAAVVAAHGVLDPPRTDDSTILPLVFGVFAAVLAAIGALGTFLWLGKKAAAARKASLERIGPPTEHTLAQKEWMSVRRMASGMPAAHAFTNSHTHHGRGPRTPPGNPRLYSTSGLGATSGASARSVWDISASGHRDGAASPEVPDYDEVRGGAMTPPLKKSNWFDPIGMQQP